LELEDALKQVTVLLLFREAWLGLLEQLLLLVGAQLGAFKQAALQLSQIVVTDRLGDLLCADHTLLHVPLNALLHFI